MTQPDQAPSYNPFDPAQVDHHEPVLAELRRRCPVSEVLPGVFYLARRQEIVDVCRQPQRFPQGLFHRADEKDPSPDQLQLGETNPPEHAQVRRALSSGLSAAKVRSYEPAIRQICDEIAESLAARTEADLITAVGQPLPSGVIGFVSGLPREDWPKVRPYSDAFMVLGTEGVDPESRAEAEAVVQDFDDHARTLIAERRAQPDRPNDLMTALVEAVDSEGRPLSDERVLTHLTKDVVVGGTETTTHLIGNLFYDLLSTPGLYERVRDDRSLVPMAVEESLRHLPPVQVLFRNAAEDTEIDGVAVPAGATLALGYASANRDEACYENPDVYDLDRGEEVRQHLGFGWGTHLCVGAHLARAEARTMLDAILDRIPSMRLAPGFTYERVTFFMMRAPKRLDVVMG